VRQERHQPRRVWQKWRFIALAAVIIYLILKISMHSSFESIAVPLSSGFLLSFELTLLQFGALLFYNIVPSNNHFNGSLYSVAK
jgi:hypothetical protein